MKKKAPSKKITKPIIETDNFWEQEIEVGEIPYGDSAKHVFSVCVKEGKKSPPIRNGLTGFSFIYFLIL